MRRLVLLLCFLAPSAASAQEGTVGTADGVRITLGGVIQARAGYGLSGDSSDGARGPIADGRTYTTFGAHAYLGARPGSRPFRLKADFVGIAYENLLMLQLQIGF